MNARAIKISVIVPVFNKVRLLRKCLQSIFRNQYSYFEVIIVDDGSSEDIKSYVSDFSCKYVRLEKNQGPAKARNIGLGSSSGELLLFTDSDCEVPVNWIENFDRSYQNLLVNTGKRGIIGGRVLPNDRFISKCLAYSGYYAFQFGEQPLSRTDLCGANILIPKDVFDTVGCFDEKMLNGEDSEFCFRTKEYGFQVIYDPSIFVIHNHEKTIVEFLRHQYSWGRVHGLQLEIRYQKMRKIPEFLLNKSPFIYLFLLVVPISLGITYRSIKANIKYDKKIIWYAFFIFAGKLSYRLGVVKWLFNDKQKEKGSAL